MNLINLFLSPNGRIGRKDFWIGFLILFVFGQLFHIVVLLGTLLWFYCMACLYAKRLHDMGHSGMLQIWAWLADVITVVALLVLGVGALISGLVRGDHTTAGLIAGSFGLMGLAFLAWFLIRTLFLLWVGLSRGQPGENRYGPPVF